jgi:hypothetical protein
LVSAFTTSSGANSFGNLSFTFSQLGDYTNYASVFDQYRIKAVEVTLLPNADLPLLSASVTGHLWSVIDYDDATNYSSIAAAMDVPNVVVSAVTDTIVRSFKPHCAVGAYASSAFSSFANMSDQWIDCGSSGVVHYGMKFAASATGVAVVYDASIKFYMEFRNVR